MRRDSARRTPQFYSVLSPQSSTFSPQSSVLSPVPRAFSLVELMIAVVILGIGLLMIGAALPIAWRGSIDLSARTKVTGIVEYARNMVQSKCLVDGNRDLFSFLPPAPYLPYDPLYPGDGFPDSGLMQPTGDGKPVSYSFLGDGDTLDGYDADGIGNGNTPISYPLVHPLHLENWAADSSNPLFFPPTHFAQDFSVPEAPILIDYRILLANQGEAAGYVWVGTPAFINLSNAIDPNRIVGAPVIRLRDRVYPPIPEDVTPSDSVWMELLSSRKFAWAVFHRLLEQPTTPDQPRKFMMYYVTLRRTNTTDRFARQYPDPVTYRLPPLGPPLALQSADDVMFPIAWRVPMTILESQTQGVNAYAYVGVPNLSELQNLLPSGLTLVAPDLVSMNAKVADMFPAGAYFIDELNGNVYRVTKRDYLAQDSSRWTARLTLDQEVSIHDLAIVPADINTSVTPEVLANANRRNRIVWVFPPPVVETSRTDCALATFSGASPVVDVVMEPMTLMP